MTSVQPMDEPDAKAPERPRDASNDDSEKLKVDEDAVLEEAHTRFARAEKNESENRALYREQMLFLSGEQWDPALKRIRDVQKRPCLVMDRTTTHVNQIVNEQRQNKPAIKVHPVDDKGDIAVANIYDGLIRHVERVSNASTAYLTAGFTQVGGGIGYWRILTQYLEDTAFEQELVIERITNPMCVYMGDAKEMDASDAEWCFITDEMSRDTFERLYPDVDTASWAGGKAMTGWWSDDRVRVAEYYRVVYKDKKLLLLADGRVLTEDDYQDKGNGVEIAKTRRGKVREVEWFKLGGASVIDSRAWPSRWLPIIRTVGNEIDIDGKITYTGLTKRAMDPQRGLNYWISATTEQVSFQGKSPYIGYKGQFTDPKWKNANNMPYPYLEADAVDVNGVTAPLPRREPPPSIPTGAVELTTLMVDNMRWITGQQEATFGAPSNEQSGRAINARARQGETATYHYVDNLAISIRHTGRVLVDMFPRVLDTARILRILGEDGETDYVKIDPDAPAPVNRTPNPDTGAIEKIFNLGIGCYDVEVSVGPSYGTRRAEAVDAIAAAAQADPTLMQKAGDIYFRNQDFPGAQEIADRLAKSIPPELRDDPGDDPEAQMKAALGQAQKLIPEQQAKLDHAQQLVEAADQEIAQLKGEIAQRDFDMQSKLADSNIKAETEKYKADSAERIAELEVRKDIAVEGMQEYGNQLVELQGVVRALTAFVQDRISPALPPMVDGPIEPPQTPPLQ